MAVYQMFGRDRSTGNVRMMASATAANPTEFILQQLLNIGTNEDVYVGVVQSFDASTGQATVSFKKVNFIIQVQN